MKTNVTRRAVLGVVIGGLVTGPFLLNYFRKSSSNGNFGQYDRFLVDLKKVSSDLSEEELSKAIDIVFYERERWLKLKYFSANARLIYNDIGKKEEVKCNYAKISVKLIPSSADFAKIQNALQIECFDIDSKKKLWTYVLDLNEDKKNLFEGNTNCMEFKDNAFLFCAPLLTFLSLSNERLESAFYDLWKITRNREYSVTDDAYIYRSNGNLTAENTNFAEFTSANGYINSIGLSREKNMPFLRFSWSNNVTTDNGFFFPSVFRLIIENSSAHSFEGFSDVTCSLSDIEVNTA